MLAFNPERVWSLSRRLAGRLAQNSRSNRTATHTRVLLTVCTTGNLGPHAQEVATVGSRLACQRSSLRLERVVLSAHLRSSVSATPLPALILRRHPLLPLLTALCLIGQAGEAAAMSATTALNRALDS
jgi:hypothetical protein